MVQRFEIFKNLFDKIIISYIKLKSRNYYLITRANSAAKRDIVKPLNRSAKSLLTRNNNKQNNTIYLY